MTTKCSAVHVACDLLLLFVLRPQAEEEEEGRLTTAQLHGRLGGVSRQAGGQESGGVTSQHAYGHQEAPALLLRPLVHQGRFCLLTTDITLDLRRASLLYVHIFHFFVHFIL